MRISEGELRIGFAFRTNPEAQSASGRLLSPDRVDTRYCAPGQAASGQCAGNAPVYRQAADLNQTAALVEAVNPY